MIEIRSLGFDLADLYNFKVENGLFPNINNTFSQVRLTCMIQPNVLYHRRAFDPSPTSITLSRSRVVLRLHAPTKAFSHMGIHFHPFPLLFRYITLRVLVGRPGRFSIPSHLRRCCRPEMSEERRFVGSSSLGLVSLYVESGAWSRSASNVCERRQQDGNGVRGSSISVLRVAAAHLHHGATPK
jgi:hypothetical protein